MQTLANNDKFKGMIVEESLDDNRALNGLDFIDVKITDAENPSNRWHIYTVQVSHEDILRLWHHLKKSSWYMHFWSDDRMIIVFPEKQFEVNSRDRESWSPAIEHGLSLGIPRGQLDFVIVK